MPALSLKSVNTDASLTFSDHSGDYVDVHLQGGDHSASRRVYLYTDAKSISRLFLDAATHQTGWSGSKVWESLEGELRLELTADRLGHVTVGVRIRNDFGGPDPWRHEGQITLELGQLPTIAHQAERLFANGG